MVWNTEDPATDILLRAAVSIARALTVRERASSDRATADLDDMQQAITRIERATNSMGDVITWASNIKRDSDKILRMVEPAKVNLEDQIRDLRCHVDQLRQDTAGVEV